ncbi:ATP-binding protein [Glutamicibacter arilaitensis]|uniref:ATP-binding protein n=1 Tax=Glutamicibacter arilaitensis TaxID=256701 RepID=UPI003FD3B33A
MATALAVAACRRGIATWFFTTDGLLTRSAKAEGRLDKELVSIAKNELLVIDEFGYLPIGYQGALLLFRVIADGHEKRSLAVRTNLEFKHWGVVFSDENLPAEVLERLVHHRRLLQFQGQSYRMTSALRR